MTRLIGLVMLALAGLAPLSPARAQDFPGKPVHIVVPYPPGGPPDVVGRLYAGKLTWRISGGQTVAFSVFGDPSRGEGDVFKISGPESTWRGTRR